MHLRPTVSVLLLLAAAGATSAAELTGRVLADQKAVVGATIKAIPYESQYATALRETRGEAPPLALATATTGADGRFKLSVPPIAPPFVVRATFGGLAARTAEGVFEGADAEDLGEITLSRGETVTGRVVDNSGKPVVGAHIRMGRDGAPVTSGKDGLFRFDDVAGRTPQTAGPAPALNLHATGFEAQVAPARFSGPVTVRLNPSTARLSGVLKDPAGKPALDAVVRVVGDVTTRWVRTDAAGKFEITGLPAPKGRLLALGKDGSTLDAAVPAGSTAATFTMARAAAVEGRVTRIDNGKLVAAVKVSARGTGITRLVRTTTDGRYRITGLPAGSYRLRFDQKNFVLLDRRAVEVTAGENKSLDVALTPAVTLTGRVNDEKGRPVSGAKGSLGPGAESRMGMMMSRMARPDAVGPAFISGNDGTFTATRLAPGENQKLTVTHPDFERRVVPGVDLIPDVPKPLSVDVTLSSGFMLSGVVKDKEGRPVEGASVALNRSVQMTGGRGGNMMSISTIESVRPQMETDYEGKFGFRGLSSGDYDVTVSKSGFTRSVMNAVKTGEGTTPLEVVLNPGASIAGRIVLPNGLPVTGYSISARPSTPSASPSMMMGRGNAFSPTDPDGGFLIEGLTPGVGYDLSIFGAGEFRGDAKKKNVVAPISDVLIEVAARGRITGRAIDAATGTPITEFEAAYTQARGGAMQVVVRMGPGDGERRTPFSSPEGTFAFEDVPPGNWDVTVWAKTYQDARTGGIAVTAGETKVVEVKAARGLVIRGRVVDARGGGAVQDASISARDGGAPQGGMFIFDAGGEGGGILTDSDGRFEITGKAPGTYQLTARHSQFSEGVARVTLEDKDGYVDIPLLSGGAISGLVMSSQGGPLAGAEVSLQSGTDGPRMGLEGQGTITDGGGRFRFDHLGAGRYKISATFRTEGSPVVDVPLNAGEVRSDIRLALDAGATVRGTISGLPEIERAGVRISAQGSQDYFANTQSNPDGSFEFAGVPKGTLTLRAFAGDMMLGSSRTAIREVVVAEGQAVVQAEIAFTDGLSISGTVTRRGSPVSGARVSAFSTATGRQSSGRSDESGAFKLSGLEAGRTNIFAFLENLGSQVNQVVELTSDTTIELVIPVAKLSGTVLDGATGLPIESTVELQRAAPATPGAPGPRLMATTDTSGRFAFEDLETVDYRLTARRSGYEAVTRTVKPAETAEDLRIELKRGSGLSIEAKDAQMGFGLRNLFVRVQEGTVDAFLGNVSLDGDGKGEIPGIPPGSYTVTAQATGYAPIRIPNIVAPSAVLRLAFTQGGTVEFQTTQEFLEGGVKTGQLVSFTGAPVGMGLGGPNSFRLSRMSQRMENLAPGRYRLTLEGGVDKTFDITEGGLAVVTIP